MKYIILIGSEVTVEYDSKVDAVQAYNEYIAVEGDYDDFTLCEVMESYEAPEQDDRGVIISSALRCGLQ